MAFKYMSLGKRGLMISTNNESNPLIFEAVEIGRNLSRLNPCENLCVVFTHYGKCRFREWGNLCSFSRKIFNHDPNGYTYFIHFVPKSLMESRYLWKRLQKS